jgi:hypothetical protein
MTPLHSLLHHLDLVRFEAVTNIDTTIKGKYARVYFFVCPTCNKIESVSYWHDEPLVDKRWWQ